MPLEQAAPPLPKTVYRKKHTYSITVCYLLFNQNQDHLVVCSILHWISKKTQCTDSSMEQRHILCTFILPPKYASTYCCSWASAVQAQLSTAAVLQNTWRLTHISLSHISHTNAFTLNMNTHAKGQLLLSSSVLNETGQRNCRECESSLHYMKQSYCFTLNLSWSLPIVHSDSRLVST